MSGRNGLVPDVLEPDHPDMAPSVQFGRDFYSAVTVINQTIITPLIQLDRYCQEHGLYELPAESQTDDQDVAR